MKHQPAQADLLIHNGPIYTLDPAQPIAEAVAVRNGKIIFAGLYQAARDLFPPRITVFDLSGRTMTPGFIESHGHLSLLGASKTQLDLSQTSCYEELLEAVAAATRQTSPGEWIIGSGWHQDHWPSLPPPVVKGFQSHQALSRISPEHPVYLFHASHHAGLANAKAMQIAGITTESAFEGSGEIIRNHQKEPTGIFTEAAQELLTRYFPPPTRQHQEKALSLAIQECLRNGITSFHDAGVTQPTLDIYQQFLETGALKVRLWVMLWGEDKPLLEQWYRNGALIGAGSHFLTVRAIKLIADGALGARGAWMLTPYSDRPEHSGHPTISPAYIHKVAKAALKHGFQLCVHAIGDRANRVVLDQLEKALQACPPPLPDHRFRIEHAQHLSPRDIPRFGKLGIIASIQGIHRMMDANWLIERLGLQRVKEGAYPWVQLLQSGAALINGSDTPIAAMNPLMGFQALITRPIPPGSIIPMPALSRKQALRAYTLDAAYAAFEDHLKGSITVGKLADFTVFSQDIMQIDNEALPETTVDSTIINGEIVYQRQ